MTDRDKSSGIGDDGAGTVSAPTGGERLTAKDASQLIRNAPSSPLFALLKQSDFAFARERVFAGYRVIVDNLKTPLARGRLITEAIADPKFAEAIRRLPKDAPAPHHVAPAQIAAHLEQKPDSGQDSRDLAALQARHKAAIKLARDRIAELSEQIKRAERELFTARDDAAVLRHKLISEQNQNAWRERKMRRIEKELIEAHGELAHRKRGSQQTSASPGRSEPHTSAARTERVLNRLDEGSALDALDRLISRGKIESVDLVIEEILHVRPADHDARRLRARLRVAQGRKAAALDDLKFVFESALGGGDIVEAAKILVMAKSISGAPSRVMANALFSSLSKRSGLTDQVSSIFEPLRGTSAYRTLESWCLPPLRHMLFTPAPDGTHEGGLPTSFLSAMGDESLIPKHIVRAIDTSNEALVVLARRAIATMDKESREAIQAALDQVADGSYFRLLARRKLSGAAIVDASNVANFERVMMAADKPLLGNILAVRDALRTDGFFPVVTIADANLPHIIDKEDQLRAMMGRDEIEIVTGGTVADEIIVREARRLGAVIVSNDYMADWDKDGEIEKIQYSISLTDGSATLYR